jgi:hypothetical protein
MIHSQRSRERLVLYFYHELPEKKRRKFEQHLMSCTQCQTDLESLKNLALNLSASTSPKPLPMVIERSNQRVLERIRAAQQARLFRKVWVKIDEFIELVACAFSRPRYQLLTASLIFIIGVFAGKIWLSTGLLKDPQMLATLLERQPGMVGVSEMERNQLNMLFANRLINTGNVEIADLIAKDGIDFQNGIVQVNLRIDKDFSLRGGLDDPIILKMLQSAALKDPYPQQRLSAVRLLTLAEPNLDLKVTLLTALTNDTDEEVRLLAGEYFYDAVPDPETIEAFKSVLLQDASSRLRRMALEYLNLNKDENMQTIIAVIAARDSDKSIRLRAQNILNGYKTRLEQ